MKEIMCFIKQIKIIFYLYMYHAATFLLRKRKLSHHTVYLCEITGSESVLGFFYLFKNIAVGDSAIKRGMLGSH